MSRTLNRLYQRHEVIPITALNAPLWVYRTWQDHRSQVADRLRQRVPASPLDYLSPNLDQPVFVLGAPRSGTTFLGDGLSVLPELVYFFEPVITKGAVRHLYQGDWSERAARRVYRQAYAWLMRAQREPQLRFCEKTPGNCFVVPFLNRSFRDARFIHIIRDGRDCALSLAEKSWYSHRAVGTGNRDPDGYREGPGARFFVEPERASEFEQTDDRHRCLWLWRRYVEEALAGCASLPEASVLELRYEQLIVEPGAMAERILDFLGIDTPGSRKLYIDTVRDSARPDSLQRWREALNDEEKQRLWTEAGELLARLDYPYA